MKKIVTPGELITEERKKIGENVFLEDNKIHSKVVGILQDKEDYVDVVALNGSYKAKENDFIVAVVNSEIANGYFLDFNSYHDIFVPKSFLKKEIEIGTVLFARIKSVEDTNIEIDNINILPFGNIYSSSPVKVPRLIGKNESMLKIFKKYTGNNILIGKNGWIWYNSEKPKLLKNAIKIIEDNSQKSNLTNYIQNYLEKNK